MRDILHIGRIGAPHGLRGEIKVQPMTDDINRFKQLKDCFIVTDDEKDRIPAVCEGVRFLNEQVLLKLKNYEDRDQAAVLRGRLISVDREHAVNLPANTWFICDLIGCEVYAEDTGYLGRLVDVIQQSAHDVYLVRDKSKPDILIPVLKTVVRKVDIEGARIDVKLPDGLYEIYRQGV